MAGDDIDGIGLFPEVHQRLVRKGVTGRVVAGLVEQFDELAMVP